jgi:hypothetical protein
MKKFSNKLKNLYSCAASLFITNKLKLKELYIYIYIYIYIYKQECSLKHSALCVNPVA